LPYQSDLSLEFFPAFNVSRSFNTCQIIFSGWTTNIPYNKNLYISHMDLINNHALFVRKESKEDVEGLIINCIKKNYNINVKMKIVAQSTDYAILEFYNKY